MRPFPCHFTGKGRRSLRLGKKKIKSVESLSFRRQQQCNGRVSGAAADRENALLRHRGTSKGASRWPQDGSRPLSERTEGPRATRPTLNMADEREGTGGRSRPRPRQPNAHAQRDGARRLAGRGLLGRKPRPFLGTRLAGAAPRGRAAARTAR